MVYHRIFDDFCLNASIGMFILLEIPVYTKVNISIFKDLYNFQNQTPENEQNEEKIMEYFELGTSQQF